MGSCLERYGVATVLLAKVVLRLGPTPVPRTVGRGPDDWTVRLNLLSGPSMII